VCSATTDAWKVYNNNAILNHFVEVFWKAPALYACQEIIEIMAFLSVPSSLSCVRGGLFHVLCFCSVASTTKHAVSAQENDFGPTFFHRMLR